MTFDAMAPGPPSALLAWPDGDPDAPWPMLFSARGRISRRRYWLWGVGALLGLGLLLHGLVAVARVRGGFVEHGVNLLLLWPALAISCKRWHDSGRSGSWVLLALVPVVGWAALVLANGFMRGEAGPNRYGPAPRA
jgi:uncharacterized membrane protein YhaH (DUF805 family)